MSFFSFPSTAIINKSESIRPAASLLFPLATARRRRKGRFFSDRFFRRRFRWSSSSLIAGLFSSESVVRYGPLSFAVKGTRILPFPAFVLGCCCGGDCRFLFRPVICWLPGWDFFFFRLHCKDGCVRSSDLRCLGHSEVLAFAAVAKRLVSFSAAGGETFPATSFLAGGGGWCCPCFSLSMEWSMFFQWLRFVVDLLRDGSCDISKALGFHGEEDGGLGWIPAGWSRRRSRRRWKLLGVCV